jgi:hypothetical protein
MEVKDNLIDIAMFFELLKDKKLRYSYPSVYYWIRIGKLKAIKHGKKYLIEQVEAERFIDELINRYKLILN